MTLHTRDGTQITINAAMFVYLQHDEITNSTLLYLHDGVILHVRETPYEVARKILSPNA